MFNITYQPDYNISAMANYFPKHTGLPMVIWIDSLGSARNAKHNEPRLKVQNVLGDKVVDDAFGLSISMDPKILAGECKLTSKNLKAVKQFVINNFEVLMKHWNKEIDDFELKDFLVRS